MKISRSGKHKKQDKAKKMVLSQKISHIAQSQYSHDEKINQLSQRLFLPIKRSSLK